MKINIIPQENAANSLLTAPGGRYFTGGARSGAPRAQSADAGVHEGAPWWDSQYRLPRIGTSSHPFSDGFPRIFTEKEKETKRKLGNAQTEEIN
jgi:hypothetical protein